MTTNSIKQQATRRRQPGPAASADSAGVEVSAALVCPDCKSALDESSDRLACPDCNKHWPVVDGVPYFTTQFPYWGEVPQDSMQRVNLEARSKNWRAVLNESDDPHVQRARGMMLNVDRANWHWLVDLPRGAQAVDIGAGTGANAEALARRFRKVYALEPVA